VDLDKPGIAGGQNHGAALVADLLVGALDHAVLLAGASGLDLARGCKLEALLGRALGLHLGHFVQSFQNFT
jgi:hypothetical protein